MTQPQPPYVPGTPQPTGRFAIPQPPKKKRTVRLSVAVIATGTALIVGAMFGGTIGAVSAGSTPAGGPTAYVTVPGPERTREVQVPAAEPTKAAPAKPAPKPAPTIEDGIWTVGDDVPAGTYKVTAPVNGMDCYWSITKSGTNGEDIIQNDLPQGGLPRVTLKKGQDFNTERCGTWKKQ